VLWCCGEKRAATAAGIEADIASGEGITSMLLYSHAMLTQRDDVR
jgi:hypothetical protein